MRTNIEIDDQLMRKALIATGSRTKREAVSRSLELAVRLKAQEGARQLRGIGWTGDLDAMRRDA